MDVNLHNIYQHIVEADIPARYKKEEYLFYLVYRVSSRLASRYGHAFPQETLKGALVFYVLCYIYYSVPLKYIVLGARKRGERLDIAVNGNTLHAMAIWGYGELPLYILARFAQRFAVPFRFHGEAIERDRAFLFRLHPGFVPAPCANRAYEDVPSRTLVCLSGYRDFDVLPPGETDAAFFWSHVAYRAMRETDVGFRVDPRPFYELSLTSPVERGADGDRLANPPSVTDFLEKFFLPVFSIYRDEAHEFVRRARIRQLYIPDHPFLDTYLLKDAVIASGGKVSFVSHGFNPSFMQMGESDDIGSIVVPTWTAADQWTHHTRAAIRVQSALAQNRSGQPIGPYTPGVQPAIHVFGCQEFVGYIPKYHPEINVAAKYVGLARILAEAPYPLYFRERDSGVTFGMLNAFGFEGRFLPGTLPPPQVKGSNLVFIFVGPATSGIYEAVGRGIPVIRTRDPETEEYLFVDEEAVPVLDPFEAARLAIDLAGGRGYDAFVRHQREWFLRDTKDGGIASPNF